MSRISESAIEELATELLEKSGYQYVYATDIAPNSNTPERNRFEDVLLSECLQSPVGKITQNKAKTIDTKDEKRINSKQICTLEKLQDTLLPKLMSREVQVEYNEDGVSYHEK